MSIASDLADLFHTAAAVFEIKGESVFKAIAFSKIARVLDDTTVDLKKAVEDGSIATMDGVGKSSQKIIEEFVRTGRSTDIDELIASIPGGLLPLRKIPSLGPKTIGLFWQQRGVTSLGELVAALDGGKLDGLKGIGPKKLQSIKEGIAMLSQSGDRRGIVDVLPIALRLVDEVRGLPGVLRAEYAGSLRRWQETIGDVDIIVAIDDSTDGQTISDAFVKFTLVEKILGQGPSKASVIVESGLQVDVRIVPLEHFGAAIQYFTGSKAHNVKLRGLCLDKGLTLNEWGLYRVDQYDKAAKAEKMKKRTGLPPLIEPVASKTEEAVYAALGMEWIPPELRQGRDEIDLAANKKLPKLITPADLRGDLHTHTTASDGKATIEEMAEAAKALGYEFLAITDHSKSQVIAGGLTAERLLKHVAAIRKANEKIKGITLFAGCEVDILVDGRMDFEDAILAELDIVVGSPHASLKQDEKTATDRILRAIDNRYVTIIGHPTGRMINRRAGLPIEINAVVARAVSAGVALEINSGWPRLDLRDTHARAALAAGVKLSINTDAHSTDGLGDMPLGISVSRRAGAEAMDVINCFSLSELRAFIAKRR